MKFSLLIFASVLCFAVGAAAHESNLHGRVLRVTVHAESLQHNHVGDSPDREVSIYLPPGYDSSDARYPVLYLLHGYSATDRSWMDPGVVDISRIMDDSINHKTSQSMIVVMPDSFNRFGGSFYTNSVLSGNWEDFIAHDLVNYIDGHYRTLSNANARGIAGHSMGGYGALRIGMQHPEIFSAAYGMSPCCGDWDENEERAAAVQTEKAKTLKEVESSDSGLLIELAIAAALSPDLQNPPFGVDWPFNQKGQPVPAVIAKWRSNMLDELTATYAGSRQRLRALGFDVGRQDEFTDIISGTTRLDHEMTRLKIGHEFSEYDGTHTSGIARRIQKVVLPFMSKNFPPDQ